MPLPALIGPLLMAGGTALASKAGSAVGDKVFGVPTPDVKSGQQLGADHRQYLDEAFPGTTPVERLGTSSPGAQYSGSELTGKMQMRMKSQEMDNQSRIADSSNRAHVISAATPMGARAVQSALMSYGSGSGPEYDTPVGQGRERLPSEVERTSGVGSLTSGRESLFGKTERHVASAAQIAGKAWADRVDVPYHKVRDFVYNSAKRPRRLGVQR